MSLGKRLQSAIDGWERGSIRAFSVAMKARGASGHSRQMIHSYISGGIDPSLGFIREAAAELGVREPWLAFESGPRTEEEEAAAKTVRDARDEGEGLWEPAATTQAREETIILRLGGSVTESLFWDLLRRLVSAKARWGVEVDKDAVVGLARGLQRRFFGDWVFLTSELTPGRRVHFSANELEEFKFAWLSAMLMGLPDRRDLPGEPDASVLSEDERAVIAEIRAANAEDDEADRLVEGAKKRVQEAVQRAAEKRKEAG